MAYTLLSAPAKSPQIKLNVRCALRARASPRFFTYTDEFGSRRVVEALI